MSPRKEIRLFIFTIVVLALGIGARTICVMRLNRYTPQWVRSTNAPVAQAATLSTAITHPIQNETVTNSMFGQNHGMSATLGTVVQVDATGEVGYVASSTKSVAPPNTQGVVDTDSISTQVNADHPNSSTTSHAASLSPETSCVNADGSKRLDINTATAAELDTLPGIGPSYAAAILQERARRGQFTTIRQLLDVRGIGPARFAKLEPLVCVVVVPESP
jgi:competence ComEA-like helix-hairpin-helix protein